MIEQNIQRRHTLFVTSACEDDPIWHPHVSLWTVAKWLKVDFISPLNLCKICLNIVCNSQSSSIIKFMAAEELRGAGHNDGDVEEVLKLLEWGL